MKTSTASWICILATAVLLCSVASAKQGPGGGHGGGHDGEQPGNPGNFTHNSTDDGPQHNMTNGTHPEGNHTGFPGGNMTHDGNHTGFPGGNMTHDGNHTFPGNRTRPFNSTNATHHGHNETAETAEQEAADGADDTSSARRALLKAHHDMTNGTYPEGNHTGFPGGNSTHDGNHTFTGNSTKPCNSTNTTHSGRKETAEQEAAETADDTTSTRRALKAVGEIDSVTHKDQVSKSGSSLLLKWGRKLRFLF